MNFARIVFALILLICGASTYAQTAPKRVYQDIGPPEQARLDQHRAAIAKVLKTRYGFTLTGTEEDMAELQRLVQEKVFSKTQLYEWQSLGVAFGDVLAKDHGLHWVVVDGERGKEPTLRFRNTTLEVNAVAMVVRRVEEGKIIDLPAMRTALSDHITPVLKAKGLR